MEVLLQNVWQREVLGSIKLVDDGQDMMIGRLASWMNFLIRVAITVSRVYSQGTSVNLGYALVR